MIKEKTLNKYSEIIDKIEKSGLSINAYFKSINECPNSFFNTIRKIKSQAESGNNKIKEFLDKYNRLISRSNYQEVSDPEETEHGIVLDFIRDSNNRIIKYDILVPIKDSIPFRTSLTREEAELIFGLYTYYGGNITARNVANEFPRFTLPEIKKIFKAFGLYKDSIWAPRHLVEELSVEELSNYRMGLKERAAFKYADAQQERDFKLTMNKMAKEINRLTDRNDFINEIIAKGITFKEYPISEIKTSGKVGIIVLSDIHCGAYNTPNGYLPLDDYNKEEIDRRLRKVVDFISTKAKDWNELIILNLGDSVDNYRGTTAKGTPLPTNMSEKQAVQMYIACMLGFFNTIKPLFKKISYICTGDSNHDSSFGWLANIALTPYLNNLNIECYVSSNPIDKFDCGNFSIVYLHGHDSRTQYKGFPLNLDEKTKNWFNNYFLQAPFTFKQNRVVVKGDLHQYSVNSCNTFDYINAPSLYGSSSYIVSNFGKGKEGTLYLEIDENNYTSGVIWN